ERVPAVCEAARVMDTNVASFLIDMAANAASATLGRGVRAALPVLGVDRETGMKTFDTGFSENVPALITQYGAPFQDLLESAEMASIARQSFAAAALLANGDSSLSFSTSDLAHEVGSLVSHRMGLERKAADQIGQEVAAALLEATARTLHEVRAESRS